MDEGFLVRDICACGRRYRVKNPEVGFRFNCPSCQREIEITEADIQLAEPLQSDLVPKGLELIEPSEPLDVIPVDNAPLRIAEVGSKIGATGKIDYGSPDAMLRAASSPRSLQKMSEADEITRLGAIPEEHRQQRTFLNDVFMSFALAGSGNNAIKLGAMGVGLFLFFVVARALMDLMSRGLAASIAIMAALIVPLLIVISYLAHFYWEVLLETANGEDEISWEQSGWDLTGDVIRPMFWLTVITLFCAAPAIGFLVISFLPSPDRESVSYILLAVGFFFWPIAVMWVAVGQSLTYLRPDLLVRSVLAVGPAYGMVWLLLLATIVMWAVLLSMDFTFGLVGPLGSALWFLGPLMTVVGNIYLGYVVFRTIGLIFRYHREKLPLGY